MQGSDRRWKFSVAVLLPVVSAVIVTVAIAVAFIWWSAQRTDARALDRQQAFAAHMVQSVKADLEGEQATVVLRYEAAEAFLGSTPDMNWIESELGEAEYDDFGHDRVYVLDRDLNPIYAARDGASVDIATYARDRAALDPLAVRFRAPSTVAELARYQGGDADDPPQVSDIVSLDGRAAVVTILPIVSHWEGQEQDVSRLYMHVAVKYLDSVVASDLADQYLVDGAHFDTVPNTLPAEAMVPVANGAGRFVVYFKWMPDRPGQALLAETLPAGIGVLGVVGAVIAALLFALSRSTRALDQARADALFRATHDPLTGVANRALFTERLEGSPLPLGLLALDLDRFKHVNDTMGHEAGDELLKQVAARLSTLVGEGGTLARLGGDEFMILVPGESAADLTILAGRIVAAIAEPFRLVGGTAQIGVSVGIARAVTDERSDLVSRADFALYDAKEAGRNTFRIFGEIKRAA